MAVFRVEKTRDYTVMANHHLKNRDLTLKAKGLLSVMLSLPDDWDFTLKGLARINREGIDAIREGIRELEQAGYVMRHRVRDERGKLRGNEYVIYERPQLPASDCPAQEKPALENPTLDNPTQENPTLEKPTLENPMQLNTQGTKTYSPNTYVPNTHAENPNPSNPYPSFRQTPAQETDGVMELMEAVRSQIGYDCIADRFNRERLDEIVELITEILASRSETITISGVAYPAALVKRRFEMINSLHIEFVFASLEQSASPIRNIKQYLTTTLFNATGTMNSYYDALVRHEQRRKYDWMDDLDG